MFGIEMKTGLYVIVLAIVFSAVQCISKDYRHNELVEPDMIRNTYLRIEKSLWVNTINDKSKSRNDRLKTIFEDHNNFVIKFIKNSLDTDNLKTLIKLYGWQSLQSDIINVHRVFMSFQQHLNRESKYIDKGDFNEEVSSDLIDHVLDDSNWPLIEAIEHFHNIIVKEKLYKADISDITKTSCVLQRSPQQIHYQLYNALTIAELQAYMMMQCSYMLLNVYEKADTTTKANSLRTMFDQKIVESLKVAYEVFDKSDRTLWRCDPDKHEEGKTFLQITRLLQGHIENEKDLNRDRSCKETCQNFQYIESDFGCSDRSICNRQLSCQGKILSCTSFKDDMWICPSNRNSLRRYEYIQFDNGVVWGDSGPCASNGFSLEYYWWSQVLWHCDHCFCICDQADKKSDRFFSLRHAVSDVKNNMVVTGLRFVKQNRIIHLQIQESQLQQYGKVNSSTTRWVPISNFSILDKGMRDGIDYHTLSFERRDVDLDDLKAPIGHVVTGVKLRRLGTHINLEMRVSEINFSSGKLVEPGNWISNDNTEVSVGKDKRSEVHLSWPNVPTKSRSKSVVKSRSNGFIKFTHSDIGKDVAQTTVPFLDSQEASTNPPMPLQGVGLFYKGQYSYGGFISPRIETLDYSVYIKANQQNFKSSNAIVVD